MRRVAIALALFVVGCAHETQQPQKAQENKEEGEEKVVTVPPSQPTPSGVAVAPSGVPGTPSGVAVAPKPLPPKVKLKIRSKPDKATVFWGKKKLGETPLDFERPRDSGPVDLVVKEDGFFPVHTRVYTFRNDVVWVKLTKLEDKMTLFGAKRDLNEPPPGSTPDGGVPLPAPPAAQ